MRSIKVQSERLLGLTVGFAVSVGMFYFFSVLNNPHSDILVLQELNDLKRENALLRSEKKLLKQQLEKASSLSRNKTMASSSSSEFLPERAQEFQCESPKVAIASLTRHTPLVDMEFWLDYHFSLGVCHIFLRIQHTHTMHYLLDLPKYRGRVTATFVDDTRIKDCDEKAYDREKNSTCRIYMDLIHWQIVYVNTAIRKSESMDIDYVFHIDDDELIYTYNNTTVSALMRKVEKECPDCQNIHFRNFEHMLNMHGDGSPFAHHRFAPATFLRDARLSYANGKSAGKVSEKMHVNGPHEMWGKKYEVPKDVAVVLHYESATIIEWFKKFVTYSSDNLNIIPFGFYKESIESINTAKTYYQKKKHVRQKEKDHPEWIMQVDLDDQVEKYRQSISYVEMK